MVVRMCGFCDHSQGENIIKCYRALGTFRQLKHILDYANCDYERADIDDGRCGPAANFYKPKPDMNLSKSSDVQEQTHREGV